MVPWLRRHAREPVGLAPAWPGRPGGRSTTPATSWPSWSAAGPARSCSPRAAPRPTTWRCPGALAAGAVAGVQRGRAPRRARPGAGPGRAGGARSTPRAWSTSTTSPGCSRAGDAAPVGVVSVLLAGNEVGHRAGPRRRCGRWSTPRRPARCSTPTRCRRSPWLDVAAAGRAGRPGVAERAQVRRARAASGVLVVREPVRLAADAPRRRPGAGPAQRVAAGRRDRRAWPPARAPAPRSARWSSTAWRAPARPPGRRAARRHPRRGGDRRPRPQGRVELPPLHPGRRGRGAAVPARPGGRVRLGGVVVRERRGRAVARPRRARRARRRSPVGRCGCRSGGPPPTADVARARSRSCPTAVARLRS